MSAAWYATLFAWLLTGLLMLVGVGYWAAIAAMTAAAVTVAVLVAAGIVAAVRRLRRVSRDIDELIDARKNGRLPGPGRHQASGVGGHGGDGVQDWTDDEIAYLRGKLKELPRG